MHIAKRIDALLMLVRNSAGKEASSGRLAPTPVFGIFPYRLDLEHLLKFKVRSIASSLYNCRSEEFTWLLHKSSIGAYVSANTRSRSLPLAKTALHQMHYRNLIGQDLYV